MGKDDEKARSPFHPRNSGPESPEISRQDTCKQSKCQAVSRAAVKSTAIAIGQEPGRNVEIRKVGKGSNEDNEKRGTILYCPVKRKYTVKEKQWVSRSLLLFAYSSSDSQHGTLRFRRFSRYDEPSTLSLPISGIAPIERLTHNPLSKLMGSARGPVLSPTKSFGKPQRS